MGDIEPYLERQNKALIPNLTQFRNWAKAVLSTLNITAYRWCCEADVPPNTISKLLSPENRGVTLSTAHKLTDAARSMAVSKNVDLPAIPDDLAKSRPSYAIDKRISVETLMDRPEADE